MRGRQEHRADSPKLKCRLVEEPILQYIIYEIFDVDCRHCGSQKKYWVCWVCYKLSNWYGSWSLLRRSFSKWSVCRRHNTTASRREAMALLMGEPLFTNTICLCCVLFSCSKSCLSFLSILPVLDGLSAHDLLLISSRRHFLSLLSQHSDFLLV